MTPRIYCEIESRDCRHGPGANRPGHRIVRRCLRCRRRACPRCSEICVRLIETRRGPARRRVRLCSTCATLADVWISLEAPIGMR